MKRLIGLLCVWVLLWMCAGVESAIVPLGLNEKDFLDLGPLGEISGWDAMVTGVWDGQNSGLRANITSKPYWDSISEDYYYFYQIENTGEDLSWHIAEVFAIAPVNGADGFTEVGWLNTNEPSPFVLGQVVPVGSSANTSSGPTISFVFPGYVDPLEPGEFSVVMYIRSSLEPGYVMGNIIDGSICQGQIIGPVPELATVWLLGLGFCAAIHPVRR